MGAKHFLIPDTMSLTDCQSKNSPMELGIDGLASFNALIPEGDWEVGPWTFAFDSYTRESWYINNAAGMSVRRRKWTRPFRCSLGDKPPEKEQQLQKWRKTWKKK